jgi:hypothetical protein
MKLILLLLFLVLGGCQSVKTDNDLKTVNSADQAAGYSLQKAQLDLAIAIESGVEWQVRDSSTGENPVRLAVLLQQAQFQYDSGNQAEAERIAVRVSSLVKLALDQQRDNRASVPEYQYSGW